MKFLSFRGGIHPPHFKKLTEKLSIEDAPEPKCVIIPMQQHIGAPCEPIVKVGDKVFVGQKIGETKAFVSAPVHSSVSGVVKQIAIMITAGGDAQCIVIESDGLNSVHERSEERRVGKDCRNRWWPDQ